MTQHCRSHPWIVVTRRKVGGYFDRGPRVRRLWRASTKLGTKPGGIGVFGMEPAVGITCEWWPITVRASELQWTRPYRVYIDRIDDVVQRVFVSLV